MLCSAALYSTISVNRSNANPCKSRLPWSPQLVPSLKPIRSPTAIVPAFQVALRPPHPSKQRGRSGGSVRGVSGPAVSLTRIAVFARHSHLLEVVIVLLELTTRMQQESSPTATAGKYRYRVDIRHPVDRQRLVDNAYVSHVDRHMNGKAEDRLGNDCDFLRYRR